jgi:type II secretory pathway pseudopilin PulG
MTWVRLLERARNRVAGRAARPRLGSDSGESLIELLIALVIMGIAVVAIVGGIATSIIISDIHRKQATAGADVRSYAEAIQNAVTTTGYPTCGNLPAGFTFSAGPGYTASVTDSKVWNGTDFVPCGATDLGIQRLSVQVASDDGRATETLDVVIRNPCRVSDSPCS